MPLCPTDREISLVEVGVGIRTENLPIRHCRSSTSGPYKLLKLNAAPANIHREAVIENGNLEWKRVRLRNGRPNHVARVHMVSYMRNYCIEFPGSSQFAGNNVKLFGAVRPLKSTYVNLSDSVYESGRALSALQVNVKLKVQ